MADLSDVTGEVANQVTLAVYPNGPSQPPIAGNKLSIMQGWPLDTDLDQMVQAFNVSPPVAGPLISIYPRPGMYRNTSRYPSKWQDLSRPAKTVTATVSDITVTIGGTPGGTNTQNVALIVGFGSAKQAFVYQTQTANTLNDIATNLAALVNLQTPATAVGSVITIPAAWSLTARVGIIGISTRELRRQVERIDINVWCPSPALRDQIAKPIRQAFAGFDYLTLADGFAARCRAADDHWLDDPEKVGLYRRCMGFDIDYPTTEAKPSAEIVVFQSSTEAGHRLGGLSAPQTFPPPIIVTTV